MLDGFLAVLQDPVPKRNPWGWSRVEGRLARRAIRVDLMPEMLVRRSLPTLWLQATWMLPAGGQLSVMLEPVGAEFFTDDEGLRDRLASPPSWQRPTEILGNGRASGSLLRRLSDIDLGEYPSLKHILLDRQAIEVTMRCARGERWAYRFLRSPRFPPDAVTAAVVEETLAVLHAVEGALGAEEEAG